MKSASIGNISDSLRTPMSEAVSLQKEKSARRVPPRLNPGKPRDAPEKGRGRRGGEGWGSMALPKGGGEGGDP